MSWLLWCAMLDLWPCWQVSLPCALGNPAGCKRSGSRVHLTFHPSGNPSSPALQECSQPSCENLWCWQNTTRHWIWLQWAPQPAHVVQAAHLISGYAVSRLPSCQALASTTALVRHRDIAKTRKWHMLGEPPEPKSRSGAPENKRKKCFSSSGEIGTERRWVKGSR